MFFDRNTNLQRQKQIAYRNQLKNEIQMKNEKLINKQSFSNRRQQQFSLISNIQTAAQVRKNKQNEYYSELKKQMQHEKQQKQKVLIQKARKQRQQQQKIKKQNQVLRLKYEKQLKNQRQGNKKQNKDKNTYNQNKGSQNQIQNDKSNNSRIILQETASKYKKQAKQKLNNFRQRNSTLQQRINTSESNHQDDGQILNKINENKKQNSYAHTYVNRVENQTFNYLPQRKYMNSYFTELLGERKRFQQEASGITNLNRIFFQQKAKVGRIQSRGLQQLKNLQKILEQKGSNYMQNFSLKSSKFQNANSLSRYLYDEEKWNKLNLN